MPKPSPNRRPMADQLANLLGWEQSILAPLAIGGEVQGLLAISDPGLTKADISAVTAFANQAVIAMETARLYETEQAAQRRLRYLPVPIFSIHAENQFAIHALRAGAAGYLTKDSAPDEMVAAIRQVARGGKYVTTSLAVALAEQLGDGERAPHETLSDRELQVMRHLASGDTITDIAEVLSLSVKTVSTYRTRILEKLHLESTADIIRYAIEHGFVE